ncbi:MAG: HAMP domain-containing histidine kinase [Coriobacteriales bacterium]|nr:HAMP domain-containing histidine kinase [Coriobacteriales bacterium]
MISLVIIISFSVIYFVSYQNTKNDNRQKLEMSLYYPSSTYSSANLPTDLAGYDLSFTLLVNDSGKVTQIRSFFELTQEEYQQAADIALSQHGGSTIRFQDKQWIYTVENHLVTEVWPNGQSTGYLVEQRVINFLDVTTSLAALNRLLITLIVAMVVTLAGVFLISLVFANRAIKPISNTWEAQKQFVSDASHELKTPLSTITANYDVLMSNKEETVESQMKWLGYMKIGIDRMIKLINDLLSLAKIEDINVKISKERFDLSALISAAIETMQARTHEKNINLELDIQPNIVIDSDAELVLQVFTILFDNAIKYTEENGDVSISLQGAKNRAVCQVRNSGEAISNETLAKAFDRFYRADSSRTSSASENAGFGLGLSIAKAIINKLDGEISAENTEAGTVFSFSI